jgi:hypothetical protein
MLSTYEPLAGNLPKFPIAPEEPTVGNPPTDSARGPTIILALITGFAVIGIAFALWLRTVPAGNPDPRFWYNVFYVLFSRNEVAGLAVVALFSGAVAWRIFHRPINASAQRLTRWIVDHEKRALLIIALSVFAIATLGTQIVFHDYAVTADEYLADFQARIFLRGHIQAQVPDAWVDAAQTIRPTYVEYFPSTHRWNATYLPVYAAMRAVFQFFKLQILLNPFLAAITLFAVYGTARNIWPDAKTNALIAVGLLASSSQFLLMSMTSYAMPAHLALNAVWLWLYSRPDRPRFFLAPFVGVLALGLHQPVFHALFAAPFLFRLVLQRKWRTSFIFAGIYICGCALWLWWSMHFRTHFGTAAVEKTLRLFNPRMAIIQPMNLLLIIGWSCLATPLLAVLGAGRFLRLPPILQDATASCLLTFGFYWFFFLDQAHGWGYRYFHGVLVCFVLVAVAGFNRLAVLLGRRRALAFVTAGILTSVLIQFPLRCLQAEAFVRPYARTSALLHAMPVNVVGIDPREAWYAADLVRNDPFLEQRPIIVSLYRLTPAAIGALEKQGSARIIGTKALAQLGMFTTIRNDYRRDPFRLGWGK